MPTSTTDRSASADVSVTPFRIDVPEVVLDDLRNRLTNTRWPDELPEAEWDYGCHSITSENWPITG